MTEAKFQQLVIKELHDRHDAWVVNYVANMGRAGVPDLLVCYRGVFLGLELKMEKGRASAIQLRNLHNIRAAKGIGVIFRHSDEWRRQLKRLLELIIENDWVHLNEEFPLPEDIYLTKGN